MATEILDNAAEDPGRRAPLVLGNHTFTSLTDKVCQVVEGPTPRAWWIAFGLSLGLTGVFFAMLGYLVVTGIGVWGLNVPAAWAFDITNFVFWVGIGHAGTLISAILFLFRQKWRTAINRFAEAMTIFAVMCALVFPTIHIGRPWFDYWLLPFPNQMKMWPQFRSPLLWDVFAVSTYFTVSLLFWYVGMIPDLATLRDRARGTWRRMIYGILALGLARLGAPVAPLRVRLPAARRARHAARALGALGGELRLRRVAAARAGTPRSSRRTSWPAPSSAASPWS